MSEGERKRFLIIPIFIPNLGCPNRCVFCHQEKITNQAQGEPDGRRIGKFLEEACARWGIGEGVERQVAFYGGTFGGLPIGTMEVFLHAVRPFLERGAVHSVRVSTRPDTLEAAKLALMKAGGVSTVEVGAQSMDDEVLARTRRGHRSSDTHRAVTLLKDHGFQVGIQLMPGLPGDSKHKFLKGVEEVMRLRPDMVRLYPTLVLEGTELAEWYREGRYKPLDLEEALEICQESCETLEEAGIPVIRMGLLAPQNLVNEGHILAGPWHPAFGFLVRARIYLKRIQAVLPPFGKARELRIRAPARDIPLLRGYRNRGVEAIERITGAKVTSVLADDSLKRGRIRFDMVP